MTGSAIDWPDVAAGKPTLLDRAWQRIFCVGFGTARAWWWLRRPHHDGALVAIWLHGRVLLVRQSYRRHWSLPGGSMKPHEPAEVAARRELAEELGLQVGDVTLLLVAEMTGWWDNRHDRVRVFDLHLQAVPALRLDNREIVCARFIAPDAALRHDLSPVARAYLARADTARSRNTVL